MQRSKLTKTVGAKSGTRKKMALGKGLGALIPEVETGKDEQKDFFFCDVDLIRPNRFQPRLNFSEEDLQELTDSIKTQGILQPLLVRKDDDGYELIAGERRLRAAKRARLTQVPVVIKRVNDNQMLEMAIVENIQRENLNPIEEAEAYHRLITQLNLTQDQASARVGKDSITDGSLSMGHARAILGAAASSQQLAAWRAVIAKGLSVRQTEALIRHLKSEKKKPRVSRNRTEEIYLSGLAEDLSRHFGTKIMIKKAGQKGKVEIEFYSNDDLDRLIRRLKKT
jgi:ParB family chromosome partitioning protein